MGQDAGDDAEDMDMSPPATPLLKATPPQTTPPPIPSGPLPPTVSKPEPSRSEASRPILAVNTSMGPQLLPHELYHRRKSASPVLTISEEAAEVRGDESDMDMSSPTSERAPSPVAAEKEVTASAPSARKEPTPDLAPPGLTLADKALAASVDSSAPSLLPTPNGARAPPRPATPPMSVKEASTQVSPHFARTKADRRLAESGELSPLASEETVREETDLGDKDIGPKRVSNETPQATPKDSSMTVDDPSLDKVVTEIPLSEALRLVARLRYRHDLYNQDARIEPVLISNRQLVSPEESPPPPEQKNVVEAVAEKEQRRALEGKFDGTKHSLRKRFAQHQAALAEKVARLRTEYIALHKRWLVHCEELDAVARNSALEEAAAAACRTTRRTAAMGDAVRSDLEMEQILASLGNEELTDANHLSAKNAAVIPDMVSVTKGLVEYVYDDTNNLVEDPHEFYKLETGIDDWTEEEKAILVEKYAKTPKQFGFIADALPNKTPSQCVTFYYLHKNTIDFRKAVAQFNTIGKRRRSGRKQKGNALLADILKHDDEVSEKSGGASGRRKRGAPSTPVPTPAPADTSDPSKKNTASTSRRGTAQNTPAATPTPDPEPAPKRPRRRANPTARAVASMEQENDDGVSRRRNHLVFHISNVDYLLG